MGFWSSLAGSIFGWSDSGRGRYDAETQNRTKQQDHERVKDLKNLEQRLSIEKEKADAEIEKFRHETMTQTATEMQKLEQEDLKFRSEFAAHLMTTIQKIQTDYLSQITSILLGYKTEHTSAVKELEAFYGKKMLDLRDELREERDIDIRDLLIGDYKELRTRGSNLMNTLINRVDKDVETMQTFVLEHTKSNTLNANFLLDKIIGNSVPSADKAKLLGDINNVLQNPVQTIEVQPVIKDDKSKDK